MHRVPLLDVQGLGTTEAWSVSPLVISLVSPSSLPAVCLNVVFVQGLHTIVINDFAFADNLDPNYIKDETIKKYPSYEGGAFTPA